MDPIEERLYEIAGHEIASKSVRPGLWTKAFSVAHGDEQRTKAQYIEFRVTELRGELLAEIARQNETETEWREREKGLVQQRFARLLHLPYQDTDEIPTLQFAGDPSLLRYPISAIRVSEFIELLPFEVADLIKRGYLKGVFYGGEWYCDVAEG